ncbi:hypothetical protein Q7P37_005293 [Cladosporium fusiforme]
MGFNISKIKCANAREEEVCKANATRKSEKIHLNRKKSSDISLFRAGHERRIGSLNGNEGAAIRDTSVGLRRTLLSPPFVVSNTSQPTSKTTWVTVKPTKDHVEFSSFPQRVMTLPSIVEDPLTELEAELSSYEIGIVFTDSDSEQSSLIETPKISNAALALDASAHEATQKLHCNNNDRVPSVTIDAAAAATPFSLRVLLGIDEEKDERSVQG